MDIGREDTRSPGARSRPRRACGESRDSAVHCCCADGGVFGLCLEASCLGGSSRACGVPIDGFDMEVGLLCESRFENEDIKESTMSKPR
jgi:hypothetical protein